MAQLATIRTGTTVPSNSVGVDGDVYINSNTNTTYVRAAGVYVNANPGVSVKQYASNGSFSYCGTAPAGSSTSSAVWTITRLTVDASGTVTAKVCATNVAWVNYLSATYTTCS